MSVQAVDVDDPTVQAQVQKKAALRAQHESGRRHNGEGYGSLPPGQRRIGKWIVLDLGVKPDSAIYSLSNWNLQVHRDGDSQQFLSMDEILRLGVTEYSHDWHCVTGWSASQVGFRGVPLMKVIEACNPPESWVCLLQTGADGYDVNVHREDALHPDAFLALSMADGSPITMEHGGPRLVFPHLFGWKSCKWLHHIQFLDEQKKGFWENLGCHMRGRVEKDERFASRARAVWTVLIGILDSYYYVVPEWAVVSLMQHSSTVLGWFTLSGKSPKRRDY